MAREQYNNITGMTAAVEKVFSKLRESDLNNLNISDTGKSYLRKYADENKFYISVYGQLMKKAVRRLSKPVSESIFIDYGGGTGILSLIAKEAGFRTVILNDINAEAISDASIISEKLAYPIDFYIPGDVEEFTNEVLKRNIKPDLICSADVLEHIYDLDHWIDCISKIKSDFSLLFITGANPCNPLISYRLKKLHKLSEYIGMEKNIRNESGYSDLSMLEERRRIIKAGFPGLKEDEIEYLSVSTRGLRKADIEKVVNEYIHSGEISYKPDHPTNTCDPYTGSWTERLIDIKRLKKYIKSQNLEVEISNSFYPYSEGKFLNIPKWILNQKMKFLDSGVLFISPSITLEIQKPQLHNTYTNE